MKKVLEIYSSILQTCVKTCLLFSHWEEVDSRCSASALHVAQSLQFSRNFYKNIWSLDLDTFHCVSSWTWSSALYLSFQPSLVEPVRTSARQIPASPWGGRWSIWERKLSRLAFYGRSDASQPVYVFPVFTSRWVIRRLRSARSRLCCNI